MKKKLETWKFIRSNLESGTAVVLIYVLESAGSSPGREGFLMAVNAKGDMHGSIGGGIMEYKFVERARAVFHLPVRSSSIHRQLHDPLAGKDRSGMICSGEQSLFFYPVQESDLSAIKRIIDAMEKDMGGWLLLSTDGIGYGMASSMAGLLNPGDESWTYASAIPVAPRLSIIGGGHCALALSRLMSTLDFQITIYDNREDLNTMEQNESVKEKFVVRDYAELGMLLPSGKNNFVVIMTFGYRTDDEALRAIWEKEFAYLGLLGSKRKIEKMFEGYRSEGIPESRLQKIHAPVGIPIHSKTPEEIAVSIAAEIIAVKNKA
jgi:xanthine dehydrogenase accessory factor